MSYHARYKGKGIGYRLLLPYQAIGTISEHEYNRYASIGKRYGNKYTRTLRVNSFTDYEYIRMRYKQRQEYLTK